MYQFSKNMLGAVAATAGLLVAATGASAVTELSVDLNDFVVTSSSRTGGEVDLLTLSDDADTVITEIRVDGDPAATYTTGVTLDGEFRLSPNTSTSAIDGTVDGGFFTLMGEGGNSLRVDLTSGRYVDSGNRIEMVFFLNGLADFESDTFSGVDVSDFADGNWPTSIIGFYFDRELFTTAGYVDEHADMDFLVVIPSPTAATAGLGLMGVLALGKRRRNA